MRRQSGKQRFSRFVFEPASRDVVGGTKATSRELCENKWMAGKTQNRLEKFIGENLPIAEQWPHQFSVPRAVALQPVRSFANRAFQRDRSAVIQWMREGKCRLYPNQSMIHQWQIAKERRTDCGRVNCRTAIVDKSGAR